MTFEAIGVVAFYTVALVLVGLLIYYGKMYRKNLVLSGISMTVLICLATGSYSFIQYYQGLGKKGYPDNAVVLQSFPPIGEWIHFVVVDKNDLVLAGKNNIRLFRIPNTKENREKVEQIKRKIGDGKVVTIKRKGGTRLASGQEINLGTYVGEVRDPEEIFAKPNSEG